MATKKAKVVKKEQPKAKKVEVKPKVEVKSAPASASGFDNSPVEVVGTETVADRLIPERDWLPEQPVEIRVQVAQAWDAVKNADDASFADCQPDFQSTLMQHAEDLKKTFKPMTGDTNLAQFERELHRLITKG